MALVSELTSIIESFDAAILKLEEAKTSQEQWLWNLEHLGDKWFDETYGSSEASSISREIENERNLLAFHLEKVRAVIRSVATVRGNFAARREGVFGFQRINEAAYVRIEREVDSVGSIVSNCLNFHK